MQAIYQQIFVAYDRCAERVKFATLEISKFMEQLKAAIPDDAHIKLDEHGCMPLFLILRVSVLIACCVVSEILLPLLKLLHV